MKVTSDYQILDSFVTAKNTRNDSVDQTGDPLHFRATSIFTIELLQVFSTTKQTSAKNDQQELCLSRIHFIDLPGTEKLKEDIDL